MNQSPPCSSKDPIACIAGLLAYINPEGEVPSMAFGFLIALQMTRESPEWAMALLERFEGEPGAPGPPEAEVREEMMDFINSHGITTVEHNRP